MTKNEVAKELRRKLSGAIKSLPDIEFKAVSIHEDITRQDERDHETRQGNADPGDEGTLHVIELTVEEVRNG